MAKKNNDEYVKEPHQTLLPVVALKCRLHPVAKNQKFFSQHTHQAHMQWNTPVSGTISRRKLNA